MKMNLFRTKVALAFNKGTASFFLLVAAMLPMVASATADFDPSTVTAKITTYVGYGIVMLAAFILGKWTLKALGVIGGK